MTRKTSTARAQTPLVPPPPTGAANESPEADEALMMRSMLENAPVNLMYMDREFVIQYMTPASLKKLEEIEEHLPIPASQIVGESIDVFHRNPHHQRRILSSALNLPHRAEIGVGPETIDLLVTAVTGPDGEYVGAIATWSLVTAQRQAEQRERQAMETLRATLAKVADQSGKLLHASEDLSTTSSKMASNADDTSSQARMVSTACEQVNASVQSVASAVEEMGASVREIAKNTADAATIGESGVKVAEETNAIVAKLGDSSAEIGQFVKVITSIAQQTNLLALNATIEAARAGTAGKGFAVVANEVKDLAKETAKATEEIGRKIEAIQTNTESVVSAIDNVRTIIRQINDYQNAIAGAVEEQSATTTEISRSVVEAARGTEDITENINGVAQAAQSTAMGSDDMRQSAKTLSELATALKTLAEDSEN